MRAMVRESLQDQPLEIPHRTVQRPSDTVILDAIRPLWVLRKEDGPDVWYQWGQLPDHAHRILEALHIPITQRWVWDPSG